MIGLTVYLNRKKLTTAGADDLSVLNAIVNAVGDLGKSTASFGKRRRQTDLWLSVGGLTRRPAGADNEHLRWIGHQPLCVGDRITVQVVRTDRPDKHTAAHLAGGERQKLNKLLNPSKSKSKPKPRARPKKARGQIKR